MAGSHDLVAHVCHEHSRFNTGISQLIDLRFFGDVVIPGRPWSFRELRYNVLNEKLSRDQYDTEVVRPRNVDIAKSQISGIIRVIFVRSPQDRWKISTSLL